MSPYREPVSIVVRKRPWWFGIVREVLGNWIGMSLEEYRWYRRVLGGHWERGIPAMSGEPMPWRQTEHKGKPPWRETFIDWQCEDF